MGNRNTRHAVAALVLATSGLASIASADGLCDQGSFPQGASFDAWGSGVAMDALGSIALVGGSGFDGGDGLVRSFSKSGADWVETGQLAPDDAFAGGALFGESIALSADGLTAAIAAPGDRLGQSMPNAGSVYVFTRPSGSSVWTKQARLTQPSPGAWLRFGTSIALSEDGNTLAIGQVGVTFAGVQPDSAWVFTRSGGQWSAATELVPTVNDESEQLGSSIALSADGSLAVVGAPGPLQANDTSVYFFARTGNAWSQQQKIDYHPANGINYFGAAVAVAGDQVMVGDPFNDEDVPGSNQTNAGAVMVYAKNQGTWELTQTLRAPGQNLFAAFGSAIAVRGDAASVGAPTASFNFGKAYVLRRDAGTWGFVAQLEPPADSLAPGDQPAYGHAVGISADGESYVVGAPQDIVNGVSMAGRGYFPGFVTEQASFDLVDTPTVDTTLAISFTLPSGRFIYLTFEVIGQIVGTLWKGCGTDELPSSMTLDGVALTTVANEAIVPLTARTNLVFTDMSVSLTAPGAAWLFDGSGNAVASGVEVQFASKVSLGGSRPIAMSWTLPLPEIPVHVESAFGGLALSVPPTNGKLIADLGLGKRNPTASCFGSLSALAGGSLPCPADVDADGLVGASDLAILLGEWGQPDSLADLDLNGDVDASDLAILLGAWGACP